MSGVQTGRLIGGRHRVESAAGQGVLGPLLRAHDEEEDAPVVVELAGDEALVAADLGARLERAVAGARLVEHPVLVRLVDVGTDDGRPYVARAWVDGADVGHRYAAGPPAPSEAAALVEQLAGALDAVHAAGQVHGDLGPACVLVRDTPSGPRAYLTGLGVRRTVLEAGIGPALTRAPETAGLPGALAPELASGAPADARADVYALACLAFELLSGTPPFTGPTGAAVLAAHASRPRPRVSGRRPELPAALDAVLERGMAIDPAERPASAGALAAAVAGAIGGDVSGGPGGTGGQRGAAPGASPDPARTGTGDLSWDVTHDLPSGSAGGSAGRGRTGSRGGSSGRRTPGGRTGAAVERGGATGHRSAGSRARRRALGVALVLVAAIGGGAAGVAIAASDDDPLPDAGAPALATPRLRTGTKLPLRPADAPGPAAQRAVVAMLRNLVSNSAGDNDGFLRLDVSTRLQVEDPGTSGRCSRTALPRPGTAADKGPGFRELQVLRAKRQLPWALEGLRDDAVRFDGHRQASWSGVAVLPGGERREIRYWLSRDGLGTQWLIDLIDYCPRTGAGS